MSPTIWREGPYRFYFWSNEADRPHVHCEQGDKIAKFWLEKSGKPYIEFEARESSGFGKHEVRRIKEVINQHHYEFLKKWYDYFRKPYPGYL